MNNKIQNNLIFIREIYEQCQYLPDKGSDVIKNHF